MDECSNIIYDETDGDMGQSDSKGARKRSTTPASKGASMSFGFKKKGQKDNSSAAISRETSNPAVRLAASDRNGNGGSKEELYTGSPVLSGRSTPLARPRKENSGQPLRTNRFGFRQSTIPKTAKVGDVTTCPEQQAFINNLQEQENKNNNSYKDNNQSSNITSGLIPTQIGSNGLASINHLTPVKQPVTTKQTIILTYTAKQYTAGNQGGYLRSKSPAIPNRATTHHTMASPRSVSASRAYTSGGYDGNRQGNYNNKYTLQTNQLPKVQYPSVKLLESKFDKQLANNSKKGTQPSSDAFPKEASTTGVGGDVVDRGGWSPHASRRLRRPRTLEMVMRGEHTFHLRELQVTDLDIMVDDLLDEAIVTDLDVIPLPKLPSNFEKDRSTDSDYPPFNRFSSLLGSATESQANQMTTSNRSTRNREPHRLPSLDNESDRDEEKASKDRLQCEKDFAKMSTSSQFATSLTRNSSKESSPSTKSEDSQPSVGSEAWLNQNAGESMALRSNDDISAALSLSLSCDEDKSSKSPPLPPQPKTNPFFPQARIEVPHNTEPPSTVRDYAKLSQHPLMVNSFTLSQNSPLQSMFMSTSMSSSAFSAGSDSQQFNLLAQDPQAALAALAGSNQSMIDDETSPADSLISSSSESNNEMPLLEKDTTVSSAYHTADNKTIEMGGEEKEVCEESAVKENTSNEKTPDKQSPHTPGTPSNSLSLSEGRDFLIDDEIADQPALIFESNSTAEQMTSSLQLINLNNTTDNTATLQEQIDSPLLNKKTKGLQNSQKVQSSPSCARRPLPPPARSPSLDTLSPCDSIASDDLICDMDLNNSLTSLNSQDEFADRLDGSVRSGLNSLEDAQLREELMRYSIKRQQAHIQSSLGDLGTSHHSTPIKHQTPSTSNSSIANIGAALPARTARLLGRSRASTPEAIVKGRTPQTTPPGPPPPTDDSSTLRMDRSTHGSMQQDIVSIKAMLLKLKRVLQEPDEGLNLTRTETLNPLDIQGSPLKYGPSLHLGEEGEASPPPPPPHPLEEVADLKRQLIFLQSQLEERERMVKLLQQQMIKYSEANSPNGDHKCNGVNAEDMCNVATQTERIRPLSQGPNMLQGLNSEAHHGGLVSWNEQTTPQKLTSPQNDCNGNNHAITSTPVSRLKKPNHISSNHSPSNHINGKLNDSYSKISNRQENGAIQNGVQLKVNCRVGSRYLQAINNKNNQIDSKGDNFCQRNVRSRSLHTSRSKSIENVNKTVNGCSNGSMNGNLLTVYNDCDSKETGDTNLVQSNIYKRHHHASYNNLNNGCISDSCESDSSCHVKCQESQHNGYNNNDVNSLTDTDENSDSGYKSLPPSIHLINGNNKSVAINGNGINLQRRSNNLDFRLSTSKNAQINKC